MKRFIVFILILLVAGFFINVYSTFRDYEILKEKYSSKIVETDIKPIKEHFKLLRNVESTYWIEKIANSIGLGPTDFIFEGFIKINDDEFKNIELSYDWSETKINFEDIYPDITGFSSFKWYFSEQFSEDLRKSTFMGDAYIDKINGIIYFKFCTY